MVIPRLAALGCTVLAIVVTGCGSEPPGRTNDAVGASPQRTFGDYPARTALSPEQVVRAYVGALDGRNGAVYCSVVAEWISGRFDLFGGDPEASLIRPLTCPEFVHGFIGYIEDCCPPQFIGARVAHIGPTRREGALLRVPVTVELTLEENKIQRKEPLQDVVWLVRERGAWRVAAPSRVSAAASIGFGSERDAATKPDLATLRSEFIAQRSELEQRLAAREASYLPVGDATSCEGGRVISDPPSDIADYLHPAPPSPTPQEAYADLSSTRISADSKSICVRWELAGDIRLPTTFTVDLYSHDAFQKFEVDVRADGWARIVGGQDRERHEYTLPGRFGISGNAASLVVDEETFAVARQRRPLAQYRPVFPLGVERFAFAVSVTVPLSHRRVLHDDLGTESAGRFSYTTGKPCSYGC